MPDKPDKTEQITVGVLGAGQLGRMLALAGYPLGLRFKFFDPAPQAPAGHLAEQDQAAFDDLERLQKFARGLSVLTYEFENVPGEAAQFLAERVSVLPPPAALESSQDRLTEKTLFQSLGIPTPRFAAVNVRDDLDAAIASVGIPCVLKTRRFGYDGKGQAVIHSAAEVDGAWHALKDSPLILESFVPFEREVSIIAVRSTRGEQAFYPLVENRHQEGILRFSLAPASEVTHGMQRLAEQYAGSILAHLDYAGVLAIEFFVADGQLIANEMAPRVHNSGHWTIEGAETSQFENHLRAILGLPLGSVGCIGFSGMLNLIGHLPPRARVLSVPGAHLHLYGKTPRPGRKVGHITVRADSPGLLQERLEALRDVVS